MVGQPSGVQYLDVKEGAGKSALRWQLITIRYKGLLANRAQISGDPVMFDKVRTQLAG